MGGGYLMIKQKSSEMGVSKKEKRGLVITEIFMILLAAVWFIPIYYLIVTTFKNPQEATQSPLGLPKVWVFQNYVDAFVNMQYPRALFNTVKITVLAVAIIVLVTAYLQKHLYNSGIPRLLEAPTETVLPPADF
jgi:raffinose/stachyose/melibiose transport system permease protein